MLRILITTSTFPIRPDDGRPRFVFDLARQLGRRCSVAVLAPGAPGAAARESWDGVEIRRFTYFLPRSAQRLAYGHGMRQNLSSWLARIQLFPYLVALTAATRTATARWRPDVINPHWVVPQGLAAALASSGNGRSPACVLSAHAGDVYLLARWPFGRSIARYVVSRSQGVMADGSHVGSALDELLGSPSGAIVQPMGVELDRFDPDSRPSPRKETIVFVGRLVEKKGLVYLLRAMPRVLERKPTVRLVVIGDGPLRAELDEEASRLLLQPAVTFEGQLGHEGVAQHLRQCAVAVVPSVVDRNGETDGMPTVVVEAMAAGARVVATAVDGIPDVVKHRHNGWLCRAEDPVDLADCILEALDEPHDASVREARSTAAALSWPNVAAAYEELFVRACESRRAFSPAKR